jgi:membrane-associated phospholipid phosphatase
MAPLLLVLLLAGDGPSDTPPEPAVAVLPPEPAREVQEPPAPEPPPPDAAPPPSTEEPKPAEPPKDKTHPPVGPPPPHTGVRATLKAIPTDFVHLASWRNAGIIASGGALALAVHPFDRDINAHLKGAHGFFVPGKFLGQGYTLVGISLGMYAFGRATDNRVVSHLGMDLLRSAAVSGALTYAIKLSVRRKRPAGNCCAFPSGHSSGTFAFASVLWRHLGWKAAVPTYTVASYVAISRLHENVHFLSDVVFGAAVGIISGRAVTHHDRHFYGMQIQPMPVPGGGVGVMVAGSFR